MSEGLKTTLRYIKHSKECWSSPVNDAAVAALAPKLGEVVLDVGAGMGASVFAAAKLVGPSETGRVVVAEPNAVLMKVLMARRLAMGKNRITVELHQDGFDGLPAADDYIDAAIAVNVMHHVDDHATAASELARVVKPGGRVLLVDQDFGPDHGHDHSPEEFGYTLMNPEELGAELTKAGFAEVDTSITELAGSPVFAVSATR